MPGYDQTGPMGQGPMTGRGIGPCGGGRMQAGRGFGRGMGMRRGFGGRGSRQGDGQGTASNSSIADRIQQLETELQQLKELHENSDNQR